MTRKSWIVLGVLGLLVVIGGAVGAIGVYVYIQQRNATWLGDAEAAYAKGDWFNARVNFERYIPQDPKNESLLLKYATACENIVKNRQGALQGAATAYQQILTYNPGNTDVRSKLIDLYVRMNEWGTLEYYTAEWLRDAPDDPTLSYYRALALDRSGRRDEAIEAYRKLAEANTEHSDVFGNLARLLRDQGMEKEAQELLEKAVQSRPKDARVRLESARYLARTSDWSRVEALLAEALSLAPSDPEVLVAHAQALSLRGDYEGAIEFGKKAVEAKALDANAYLAIAGAYSSLGKIDEAIAALAAVDPILQADNPAIPITLADLQLGANRFDDAHKTAAFYKDVNPNQMPIAEYFAAKEQLVKGEPAAAVERLASVVQLRPGFMPAQYALALAYMETGEHELARGTLEAYLARNPADIRAQQLLSQRYGKPLSLEDLAKRAEDTLNDEQSDALRLASAASALFDSASRSGRQSEFGELARKLLSKATERDPKSIDACRVLVNVCLGLGDPAGARAALDKAASAGIEADALALSRASIALATNDEAAARAAFAQASGQQDFGRESYLAWAALFAGKGKDQAAQEVLEQGVAKLESASDKQMLEVERAALKVRSGDTAGALDATNRLAGQIDAGTPPRAQLNAVRLQAAARLLDLGEASGIEQAKQAINAVRAEEPDNLGLLTLDATILLQSTPPDYDTAESLFERAVSAPGGNLRAQWGLARVALARADYPKALGHLERALVLAPLSKDIRVQMADVQMKLKRPREAEATLNALLAADPGNVDALRLLVASYVERNQPDKAKETLARLEQSAQGDAKAEAVAATLRGRLLLAQGSAPEAEAVLRAQATSNPDDFEAVYNLAVAVSAQGKAAEAEQLIESFAKTHGATPQPWVALARLTMEGGNPRRFERASTALTRALLADPQNVEALRAMLELRLRQGAYSEALGLCDRYLTKNPDDAEMLNTKAALLVQANARLEEALASADRAVSLAERPEYKATRGLVLAAMGEFPRALRDLETAAVDLKQTSAQIDAALAEAYLATGDPKQARQWYDSAAEKAKQGEFVNPARMNQLDEALKTQESKA